MAVAKTLRKIARKAGDLLMGVMQVTRQPLLPDPPTSVSAAAGDGQAVVSFTPPVYAGTTPILTYTATANPGGKTASGSGSPITVAGLTDGTAYSFTVTARNGAGSSVSSAASSAVTPQAAGGGTSTITHGIQLTKAMVGHTAYFDTTLGRNLTDADLTAGPTKSSAAGQVIYGKKITGGFDQNHNNVTLRGCWIVGAIVTHGNTGLVLDYCEIGPRGTTTGDTVGNGGVAVQWSDYSANRCYVHNFTDGFHPNGNCTITECYIDGQEFTDPSGHHDSIQVTQGSNITILRCYAFNNNGETSCYQLGSDQGAISNVLVKDSYGKIDWGSTSGYALYLGDSGCSNIRWEGMLVDSWLGDSRATHDPARPVSGHITGCAYTDGTKIPDESWGGL